ncbi:MAG: NAD(P)-dependent oxidoreductase [Bacillota bacterium]
MKSAVVTGANGFVGRALVSELRSRGVRVLAVVRRQDDLPREAEIVPVTLDLSHIARLPALTGESWDVFYHLAWTGTAGELRKDAAVQLACVQAATEAVRAAKAMGCGLFIGAGSIMEKEVLAGCADPDARPKGGHIYSAAKLAAHQMTRCLAAELGIGHIWAMITNAYGEGECSPRLINATLRKLLRREEPRFTQAAQCYDFIHVADAARAFWLLGERGKAFHEYIVGSGGARPLREYLEALCRIAAPDVAPVFGEVPFDGISLPPRAFDTAALEQDTGFVPDITFEEGICRTLRSLQESDGQQNFREENG